MVGKSRLTIAVARRAARSRARARDHVGAPKQWARFPADTDLPRPTIVIAAGGHSHFSSGETTIDCDRIALSTLPIVAAGLHSGRHPAVIQRTIFDASFQSVLHDVKSALTSGMDEYVEWATSEEGRRGDVEPPKTIEVGLRSEHGRYRAIALGFATRQALREEGFRPKLVLRGGKDPCSCEACTNRDAVGTTSNEARARLTRIWGAKPRLWPPRIKSTEGAREPNANAGDDEDDLQAAYERQGREPLPEHKERKLRPNRPSSQAVAHRRRKRKLRQQSVAAARCRASAPSAHSPEPHQAAPGTPAQEEAQSYGCFHSPSFTSSL